MKRIARFALAGMSACSPAPRAAGYFKAHIDEAAKVMADCETGSHRGPECANADQAIEQSQGATRMARYKKSFGG